MAVSSEHVCAASGKLNKMSKITHTETLTLIVDNVAHIHAVTVTVTV